MKDWQHRRTTSEVVKIATSLSVRDDSEQSNGRKSSMRLAENKQPHIPTTPSNRHMYWVSMRSAFACECTASTASTEKEHKITTQRFLELVCDHIKLSSQSVSVAEELLSVWHWPHPKVERIWTVSSRWCDNSNRADWPKFSLGVLLLVDNRTAQVQHTLPALFLLQRQRSKVSERHAKEWSSQSLLSGTLVECPIRSSTTCV